MKAIRLVFLGVAAVVVVLGSGCTGHQAETTLDVAVGPTSTAADSTTTSGATTISLATTLSAPSSPPITAEDIKSLAPSYSAFAPGEIRVVDFETFGDWAAAYVTAEGADIPLVVFTREGDGWVVFDIGTGIGPDDLRSEGVPEDVIEWAFP